MKPEAIRINGADVTLCWGEGPELGKAVHTAPSDAVGEFGPSDGETFELDGKTYVLGIHDYSTDQPGHEGDTECVCVADIRLAD